MWEVPTLELCGANLDRVRRRLDDGLHTTQTVAWAQPQAHGLSLDSREAGQVAEPIPPPPKRRALSPPESPALDAVRVAFALRLVTSRSEHRVATPTYTHERAVHSRRAVSQTAQQQCRAMPRRDTRPLHAPP